MTSPGLSVWTFLSSTPTLHCGRDAWLKGEGSLPHTLTHTCALTHTHKHMLPQRSAEEAASAALVSRGPLPRGPGAGQPCRERRRGPLQAGAGLSSASRSTPQQSHSDPRSPRTALGSRRSPSQGPQLAAGVWAGSLLCPSRSVDSPLRLCPSPRLPLQTPREPTCPPQNLHHQAWAAMGGKRSSVTL